MFISNMWQDFYKSLNNVNVQQFWKHPTIKQTITAVGPIYKNEMLKNWPGSAQYIVGKSDISTQYWDALHNSLWRYVYYTHLLNSIFGNLNNYRILGEI